MHSFAMNMTLFGDHIFPYGDLKKIQSPVGACLKKLISDPVDVQIGYYVQTVALEQ